MQVKLLFSHNLHTKAMQSFDVFEKFKVVVMPVVVAQVAEDFGDKNIEAIKATSIDYDLVAIFTEDKVYYRNPEVKVISDGRNWATLDDYLPKGTN